MHGDEVDLDQLAQLRHVLFLERHDLGDAGVRHGDVEAPVARERVLDETFEMAIVAHVADLDRQRRFPPPGARAPRRRARLPSPRRRRARRMRTKRSPRPREAPVTTATRPSRRNNPSISGAGIGAGYIVAAVALRRSAAGPRRLGRVLADLFAESGALARDAADPSRRAEFHVPPWRARPTGSAPTSSATRSVCSRGAPRPSSSRNWMSGPPSRWRAGSRARTHG